MRRKLAVLLVLVVAVAGFSRLGRHHFTDRIPASSTISGYAPVSDCFGYDPAHASELYEHPLTFYNFDPDAHAEQPLYRKALGLFLTHTTNHILLPLWARVGVDNVLGDPQQRLRELGFLPSPFRYQTDNWTHLAMHNSVFGDVGVPTHLKFSLNETATVKDGATYTGINCHLCHSGIYGDSVVGGAPNKDFNPEWMRRRFQEGGLLDFTAIWKKEHRPVPPPAVGLLPKLVGSRAFPLSVREHDGQLLADLAAYGSKVSWNIFGPASTPVVGAQTATWVVFADAAFYKRPPKDLDDFQTPEDAERPGGMLDHVLSRENNAHTLAASRPWWVARYMGLHFWPGITPTGGDASAGDLMMDLHTPRYGSLIAPPAAERWQVSQALQTYIATIDSPPFPRPIDPGKADAGMALYDHHCAGCHGEVRAEDGQPVGPEKKLTLVYRQSRGRVLLDDIGTDPDYIKEYQRDRPILDNYMASPEAKKFGLVQRVPRPDEPPYLYAPPLIGLWASAPYLHNGSVPNVYEVLNADARPTYWALDDDPYAYDYDRMGVAYRSLPSMPSRREAPRDWRAYDTTRTVNGMTNVGHLVGQHLTDGERYQIIEFLKCLGTKNVRPEVIVLPPEQPPASTPAPGPGTPLNPVSRAHRKRSGG